MKERDGLSKPLADVIRSRRSVRSFTGETPPIEEVKEVVKSAIFAPYGGATGIPLREIRKIFVFSRHTESMKKAEEMLLSQIGRNARKINLLLTLLPFLRKKMQPFSNKLNSISENGIPSLHEGSHFIIVAEKKGFPPVAKQSIAHAMQNMWLTATNLGLGFQLVSATGIMSRNEPFLKLLGLKKGDYEIDGCVIGVPKEYPERTKDINIDDYVTWKR
jgi:nitroreductase